MRRRTAVRQARHHRRCKNATAAVTQATVAAADIGASKKGGAPLWEGANLVLFGAACEGRRPDRLGPQQGVRAHVSSALNYTLLSSLAA